MSYKPGHRTAAKMRPGDGKMSKNRLAWCRTFATELILMRYTEEDNEEDLDSEAGDTIRLVIPRRGTRPFGMSLTALTHEELVKVREFFNLAIDTAEPIVLKRDKAAKDAFAEGDDSFARSYRSVPIFVVRPWTKPGHSQSVFHGPPDDANGTGRDLNSDDGVRGHGGEVANGEPEASSSQDDRSAPDEFEGVC